MEWLESKVTKITDQILFLMIQFHDEHLYHVKKQKMDNVCGKCVDHQTDI
jgi:hypothetical protein